MRTIPAIQLSGAYWKRVVLSFHLLVVLFRIIHVRFKTILTMLSKLMNAENTEENCERNLEWIKYTSLVLSVRRSRVTPGRHTTPRHATPHHATPPHHATSRHVAPRRLTTPRHATSCYTATPRHVTYTNCCSSKEKSKKLTTIF